MMARTKKPQIFSADSTRVDERLVQVEIPSPTSCKEIRTYAESSEYWDTLINKMFHIGLASTVDLPLLDDLKFLWFRMVNLKRMCAERGEFIEGVNKIGEPYHKTAPWVVELKHTRDQFLKIAIQFGLSPSSRGNIALDLTLINKNSNDNPIGL